MPLWKPTSKEVVQCTQTATIRQRQLANRSTGSRFAVDASRYTENLINHLSLHGNAHRKSICKTLRKYSASGHERGLEILSNRTTRHSWCRPVIPEVDLQDTQKILRKWPRKGVKEIVESNDSSQLMSTLHIGLPMSRFVNDCWRIVAVWVYGICMTSCPRTWLHRTPAKSFH